MDSLERDKETSEVVHAVLTERYHLKVELAKTRGLSSYRDWANLELMDGSERLVWVYSDVLKITQPDSNIMELLDKAEIVNVQIYVTQSGKLVARKLGVITEKS